MAESQVQIDPDLSIIMNQLDTELKASDTVNCALLPNDTTPKTVDSDISDPDSYCVEYCAHGRQQGSASMIKCGFCMQWFHPTCCGEDKKSTKGFWTCLSCRNVSKRIQNLERKVDLLANLNMKLIVLLHDKHAKFLEPTVLAPPVPTQNMNKNPSCGPTRKNLAKVTSTGTQTALMDVINAEQDKPSNDQGQKDTRVTVVCDSIPICIESDKMVDHKEVSVEIKQVAPKINQAVDFVQDHATQSDFLIIHTGTNNMFKESVTTINRRFERLETNLIHKKIKNVAVSSVVYRHDNVPEYKIRTVNRTIRNICNRNQWKFVDNDNIDQSCLAKDKVHLNEFGFERIMLNFKVA